MLILVTGCAGFIGSHVVTRLLERGFSVVGIDNFDAYYSPARKWQNISSALSHPRFRLEAIDIRDSTALQVLFARARSRKVVHLAALAGVRASMLNPTLYAEVNVGGTDNILKLAAQHAVENFVFASSSSVYGEPSRIPATEDDTAVAPLSPYAETKLAGEQLCYAHHHRHGLNCTCLRLFTVYGPRGRSDMAPYLFVQSVLEGHELTVFGDGSSRRDYTYIDDIVDGILAALDANLPFETINLGNARPVPLRDLIDIIQRHTGRPALIRRLPVQPGDVSVTCASIAKAQRLLGYTPKIDLEEGMARFICWYQSEYLGRTHARSDELLPLALRL